MARVCFYSDDSYVSCGRKVFTAVLAGVAIQADRANVREALIRAERISGKGLLDWHSTPRAGRAAYIEAALDIPGLHARVFYWPFDRLEAANFMDARTMALAAAIGVYTSWDCQHSMWPEGMRSSRQRYQLRTALRRSGCPRVTVEGAQFALHPEVRLSDALAGYVRGEFYGPDGARAPLTNLPDLFVNLEPKNETPRNDPGGEKPGP